MHKKHGLVHMLTSPESEEVIISRNILAILHRILVRLFKHFRVWSPLELIFYS